MKFLKFIQDHSGMVPGASGHRKTFKNLQIFPWESLGASGKNLKNSSENIVLNDFLDLFFKFFHAGACIVPAGGLEVFFSLNKRFKKRMTSKELQPLGLSMLRMPSIGVQSSICCCLINCSISSAALGIFFIRLIGEPFS